MRLVSLFVLPLVVAMCAIPVLAPGALSTDHLLVLATGVGLLLGLLGVMPAAATSSPPSSLRPFHLHTFAFGATSLLGSITLFAQDAGAHGLAWMLYAMALACIIIAASGGYRERIPRREMLAVVAVVGLGTTVRLYELRSLPFGVWFDEAQNILVATRILKDPSYRPVFVPDLSQLPALPFYYYAAFIKMLGSEIFALRVAVTTIGTGSIITTWLLARELFGPRVALIAACLIAVSRWHLTFSRFGMANIFVTFFGPLVLYLFIRSQRNRSPRDGILAGIALGLGLQTYYSFLALPALLVGILVVRACTGRSTSLAAMATLLLTTCAVYAPVGMYASRHWSEFSQRIQTVATVSPHEALALPFDHSAEAQEKRSQLRYSFLRHVRMFHYFGDVNGRHNLPTKPMLDPVTGILFVMGLAVLIFHLLDWRALLLYGYGILFLSAGIFSIPQEAPQAARTLGITPIVAIICALPLGAVRWEQTRRWCSYAPEIACIGLIFVSGWLSLSVFHVQLNAPSVWAEYSAAQTRIGQITHNVPIGGAVSAPERLAGGPTLDLIATPQIPLIPFHPSNLVPLPCSYTYFVYTFTNEQFPWFSLVQQLYPDARVKTLQAPGGDAPLLHELHVDQRSIRRICLSLSEIGALQRVWVRTHHNGTGHTRTLPGGLVLLRPDQVLEHAKELKLQDIYPTSLPLGALTATERPLPLRDADTTFIENYPLPDWHFHETHATPPFVVNWRGTISIETPGVYVMLLQVQDRGSLTIDGTPIIRLTRPGARRTAINLSAGEHTVQLSLHALTGYYMASWQWRPPGESAGFSVVPSRLLRPEAGPWADQAPAPPK